MKRTTVLSSLVALLAFCACVAASNAEDMKQKQSVQPGEQVLMTAELPLALGGEWTGGDAMPLGGPNPIDETKTETVKYWLFLPVD